MQLYATTSRTAYGRTVPDHCCYSAATLLWTMDRYKQPEAPNWKGMTHVLRRASRHYSNQSYEEALCTVFKESGDARYWGRSVLNLQLPPLFELECK